MLKACSRVHSSQQGLIMLFNKAILQQRVIHSGCHLRVCLGDLQYTTCLFPPLISASSSLHVKGKLRSHAQCDLAL